jgi:flagellar hook-basal body complex protein FliE
MVDQIGNSFSGAKAYGAAQSIADTVKSSASGETSGSGDAGGLGGMSFGDILGTNLKGAIDTIKNSEKVSADAITGKANLIDVTQAVSSAKLTLDTVVAVRDNVIEAYQRVMQMPI